MLTVMSQNAQHRASAEGRWSGLVDIIRGVAPQVLLLQEVDWLADPDEAKSAAQALGMSLVVAPSRNLNTAVAWDPEYLELLDTETRYSASEMHHGYCAPRFKPLGLAVDLPAPLVVLSTHLTPYSAQGAAQEAQLLCTRAYRYGGFALIVGDINHAPLGDDEPDWSLVQPYNRTSRCRRRGSENDPWKGNRIVGQTFRDAEFTDVAAYIADLRGEPGLRQPTGKAGLLRVDQAHVTPGLVPALTDYWRVDPGPHSDHYGIAFALDLDLADVSRTRSFT
jgi:endonuclease/exonuclease/phosphatase family metal-dependent hydrolase